MIRVRERLETRWGQRGYTKSGRLSSSDVLGAGGSAIYETRSPLACRQAMIGHLNSIDLTANAAAFLAARLADAADN